MEFTKHVFAAGSVTNTYDADGRRVTKSNGTNYWYGPSGAVLAETDSSGVWTNYIFFAGQRLARNVNGDIKYYITDHLHSTGMFVDKAGTPAAVLDDNDFYPWGGAVPGVGKTTSNNTIKFTGQYRDSESQLDYFGARYYSNILGRFMSPDWAAKPITVPYAKFGDPQTLNLYAYVENGPMNRTDEDGHGIALNDGNSGFRTEVFFVGPTYNNLKKPDCCAGNGGDCSRKAHKAHSTPNNGLIFNPPTEYQEDVIQRLKKFIYDLLGVKEVSNPVAQNQDVVGDPAPKVTVPLKIIHLVPPLQTSASYQEWNKKSSEEIIDSLRPDKPAGLKVYPDGAMRERQFTPNHPQGARS